MSLDLLKRRREIQVDARAAGTLERGLARMQELIDHALNVATVASGIQLRTEHVRLGAILEEAKSSAALDAEEKKVELRTRINDDHEVDLDLRLVRSALNNLVSNAVKYTDAGGIVELRGSVTNGRATIEVEDCCGGLPPGMVEKAFAPFVRMNDTKAGFGLGLAIVKQAVDAHGGTVRVQNLPGKGCVFTLEFPVA